VRRVQHTARERCALRDQVLVLRASIHGRHTIRIVSTPAIDRRPRIAIRLPRSRTKANAGE
jgi:hypothetical protein